MLILLFSHFGNEAYTENSHLLHCHIILISVLFNLCVWIVSCAVVLVVQDLKRTKETSFGYQHVLVPLTNTLVNYWSCTSHHQSPGGARRGIRKRSMILLGRTREGHHQSDEHWNRFKGNAGELLRNRAERIMPFLSA